MQDQCHTMKCHYLWVPQMLHRALVLTLFHWGTGSLFVCLYVCMYVCLYACMYLFIC